MSVNESNLKLLNQTEAYGRTDKYQIIPTMSVIKELETNGWTIKDMVKNRVRNKSKEGFQPHEVRLQNDYLNEMYSEGLQPEIVINNSYDGNEALKISFGIFRLVCSNGLRVQETELLEPLIIKHIGTNFQEKVNTFMAEIEDKFLILLKDISKANETKLSKSEQVAFANKAIKLRLSDSDIKIEDISQLLTVNREEDLGQDLFTVFNVIQENLIQGNYSYLKMNKRGQIVSRKARPITNIGTNIFLNKMLWKIFSDLNENL